MERKFTEKDYKEFRKHVDEADRLFRFGLIGTMKPEKYPAEMGTILAEAAYHLAAFQSRLAVAEGLKNKIKPPTAPAEEEEED